MKRSLKFSQKREGEREGEGKFGQLGSLNIVYCYRVCD